MVDAVGFDFTAGEEWSLFRWIILIRILSHMSVKMQSFMAPLRFLHEKREKDPCVYLHHI